MRLKEIARASLRRFHPRQMVDVMSLAWSPDGKVLAIAAFGGHCLLWRPLESRTPYASFQMLGGLPRTMAFLGDGSTFLASPPADQPRPGSIRYLGAIYDTVTAAPIRTLSLPLPNDGSAPYALQLDAARRRAVFMQGTRRQLAVLDTASWQMIARVSLAGPIGARTVALSADGKRVFMGGQDGTGNDYNAPSRTPTALVRAYDIDGDELRQVAEIMIAKPTYAIASLSLSPDGLTLAAAGDSSVKRTNDPDGPEPDLDRVFLLNPGGLGRRGALRWPGSYTYHVDHSPSGRFLAAMSGPQLTVADMTTGHLWQQPIQRSNSGAIAWRPGGPGELLAFGDDETVVVAEIQP